MPPASSFRSSFFMVSGPLTHRKLTRRGPLPPLRQQTPAFRCSSEDTIPFKTIPTKQPGYLRAWRIQMRPLLGLSKTHPSESPSIRIDPVLAARRAKES